MVDIYRTDESVTVKRAERFVNGKWEYVRYPDLDGAVMLTGLTEVQMKLLTEMFF
jgi:hypothetical protein